MAERLFERPIWSTALSLFVFCCCDKATWGEESLFLLKGYHLLLRDARAGTQGRNHRGILLSGLIPGLAQLAFPQASMIKASPS